MSDQACRDCDNARAVLAKAHGRLESLRQECHAKTMRLDAADGVVGAAREALSNASHDNLDALRNALANYDEDQFAAASYLVPRDDMAQAVRLLDAFDRYSAGSALDYLGSPFEAEVREFLRSAGSQNGAEGIPR